MARMNLLDQGGSLADLREHNLARVMHAMLPPGPRTREMIERETGMRASTLTKIVDDLRERGLVTEGDPIQLSQRGRPSRPLLLSTERWALLGLVFDRAEVTALLGYLNLEPIAQKKFPVSVSATKSYHLHAAEVLAWAADEAIARGLKIIAIEVGSPGAVNRATGEVVRSEPNLWDHLDLIDPLQELAQELPDGIHSRVAINIDRVANYAMVGRLVANTDWIPEAQRENLHSVIYFGGRYALTGGFYDSSVFHGATGLAGEYGHLIVDTQGEACWCGRIGCLETKIGLATLHRKVFGSAVDITEIGLAGPKLVADLVDLNHRDPAALADILREGGYWLAAAIDMIASVANPSHVVIDGYLAKIGDPFIASTLEHLAERSVIPAVEAITTLVADGDPSALTAGTLSMGLSTVAQAPNVATDALNA